MALFDWNASIQSIPDEWRATKGSGVKIAVLDTGADLSHPALAHLDVNGRKFDVTQDDFDPDDLKGKDDVVDDYRSTNPHGTKMLSILAGKVEEQSEEQLRGVAPDAEVYIIKVGGHRKSITLERFLLGMELALKLNVDIISTSFLPNRTTRFSQSRVDAIFEELENKNILLCGTLENTGFLDKFNKPDRLPTMRDEVLKVGTMFKVTMDQIGSTIQYDDQIALLLPEIEVAYCGRKAETPYEREKNKCSTATAGAAGLLALLLAFHRQQDPDFERFTKEGALEKLAVVRHAFDFDTIKNCTTLQFFSPIKNNRP